MYDHATQADYAEPATEKTWEGCYREWCWDKQAATQKEAYGAGWRAALSQCLARLEDEETNAAEFVRP